MIDFLKLSWISNEILNYDFWHSGHWVFMRKAGLQDRNEQKMWIATEKFLKFW